MSRKENLADEPVKNYKEYQELTLSEKLLKLVRCED